MDINYPIAFPYKNLFLKKHPPKMQVSGLGCESFDKYKANKDYFEDVKEFISDSRASIQQFANYLEAVNNKIKNLP